MVNQVLLVDSQALSFRTSTFTSLFLWFCLFVLRFYDPVNTIKVMSSQSVNLSTLFLGRLPEWLTSTKCLYFASN